MKTVTKTSSLINFKNEYHLKEYKNLVKEIDNLDRWVDYASNNGLFCEIDKYNQITNKLVTNNESKDPVSHSNSNKENTLKGDKIHEKIQQNLEHARNNLENDNFCGVKKHISNARFDYNSALYSTTKMWRFINIYGGLIWIYLAGFLSLVLFFYTISIHIYFEEILGIEQAAIHAVTWGCIGGILRGLWYLKDKVSERQYKNSWCIFFLSVPFLGAIFGAIVYLILVAGLLSLGVGDQTNSSLPEISRPAVIIPIAALAGFNWEWAITIFKRIGDLLTPNQSKD